MPYFQEFNDVFVAGREYDRIARLPRTVAAMLFFVRPNGSVGGGPFFVWSSEAGEARHIASSMRNINKEGKSKEAVDKLFELRSAFAYFRAGCVRVGDPGNYRQAGHSEEFLVKDFPICVARAGGIGTIRSVSITISRSPCIAGEDETASDNFGILRGCYHKLMLLASKYPTLRFDVSFDAGFGAFAGDPRGAATYMNNNRLRKNIEFDYSGD